MEKKRCVTCNRSKLLAEFNKNHATKDGRQSSCRPCTRGYDARRLEDPATQQRARNRANEHYYANRDKKRRQVAEYQMKQKIRAIAMLGGECKLCLEDHPAALQFHHRDPSTKLFNITTKILAMPKKWPWRIIEEEIAKCDLLCGNCHAKHHSVWAKVDGVWELQLENLESELREEVAND